jgi:hypothetical protein
LSLVKWMPPRKPETAACSALWGLCRGLGCLPLPDRRVTVRFDPRGVPRNQRRFWVLVHQPEPEVCVKPPGFDEDLVIATDPDWLARWALGQTSLGGGMKARRVEAAGPRELVRNLVRWAEQAARAAQGWGRLSAA